MNLAIIIASAMTISPRIDPVAPWALPPIKTGTQKYFGPGRRLPKHLIGSRRATRRSEAFIKQLRYHMEAA